jgi:hypothetical protein
MISAKFVRRGDDLEQSVRQVDIRFDIDADRQPGRVERYGGDGYLIGVGQRADQEAKPAPFPFFGIEQGETPSC